MEKRRIQEAIKLVKFFFPILVGYKSGFKKAKKYPQFKWNAFDCKENLKFNLKSTTFDTICGKVLFYDI